MCSSQSRTGELFAWGEGDNGALGLENWKQCEIPRFVGFRGVLSVACGQAHTLVLTNDGVAYSFGSNSYGFLHFHCAPQRTSSCVWLGAEWKRRDLLC